MGDRTTPTHNKNYTPLDEFGKHFFAEWNEDEWCLFDNFMTTCLQDYLNTGLVKSQFVNLQIRQLSAETSHDFIEWVGLVDGHKKNESLRVNARLPMQDLYFDFIGEYPDYGPKAKMTISRTRFYRWVVAYGQYTTNNQTQEGRDSNGRWIIINSPKRAKLIQSEMQL